MSTEKPHIQAVAAQAAGTSGFKRSPATGKYWALTASSFLILVLLLVQWRTPGYILCSKSKNIYTVDKDVPRVECISVKGTRVMDTGDYAKLVGFPTRFTTALALFPQNILSLTGLRPRIVNVDESHVVVPGLADAHAHVIENGYMQQLPLDGCESVDEVVHRVKKYVLSHPDVLRNTSQWIEGMGWDQTKWPGQQFPVAADLESDPLLKGRPISLSRVDGHARWVSPTVLKLMGQLPKDVDGGLIVRDDDGKPTGIFVDNAMALIPTPPWSHAQVTEFYDLTVKAALSFGLTSIHDADTKLPHIELFRQLTESGDLPLRLYLMGNIVSDDYWGHQIPRLVNYGKHQRLNLRSVKLFADGALGSWGASLMEPYSDRPDTRGLLLTSPQKMRELVHQFWKDGWQTNIHCIGDRANHVILNIYEEILEKNGGNISERRPRIEHAQIFTPEDLERVKKLGVIASVQPTHATSDMWMAEKRLGPERIKGAYAYKTLLNASPVGSLPLGSDFPVEGVNPLLGFYAATSRLSTSGTSPHGSDGWFPEQKLSREEALKGMTLDAAYASFAENDLGSLVPGKKADFVIFDKNIMTVPFEEILKAKVRATVVDGQVMYGSLS